MKSNLYDCNGIESGVLPSTDRMILPHSQPRGFEIPTMLEKVFMKIVTDSFLSMKIGQLKLILPDGRVLSNHGSKDSTSAIISVKNYEFFRRCVMFGAIGFAEAYIDNLWSSSDLTAVIAWFIDNADQSTVMEGSKSRNGMLDLFKIVNRLIHLSRPNTKTIGKRNISSHYDLSNELFELILDKSMTYSSALYEKGTDTLEQAQANKYEKLCKSLKLNASDQVLEIGCGWGGFAAYAAKTYGCRITAITISEKQYEYAKKRIKTSNLSELVEIKLIDYRDLQGKFDKIVSIEMVEALGDGNVDNFFSKCSSLLTKNGLISIQMISSSDNRYKQLKNSVDFIQKHIFPGSLLLSIERVVRATSQHTDLQLLELHDFAESYARTLAAWRDNFVANSRQIRELGFDDQFVRKWMYYFSYCEAAFDTRQISVLQLTLTRPNNKVISAVRRQEQCF